MDIRLPRLGEGADSGSVVKIFVKEGDLIKKDQNILDLENEKAVASIPSPASGKVAKVFVKEGEKISVGQLILSLSDSEQASAPQPEAAPSKPAGIAAPAPTQEKSPLPSQSQAPKRPLPSGIPIAASPTIRKIARDLGIDLSNVHGSQLGGRIVLEDLRAYVQQLQQLAFQQRPSEEKAAAPATEETIDFSKWGPITKKPLTSLRKAISRQMMKALTIPHVTQFDEADVTKLMALRKKYSPRYEKKDVNLTLTPFILKAIAVTLKKYPIFNSSLSENGEELIYKEYIHIGIAVDTEEGLIVPVLRDVDKKNLLALSKELQELAEKTRDRKVSADDLKGSSFTISNQGGIGGGHFTPIINKPNVAILGIGRGATKPVFVKKKIQAHTILPVCLSYDHRVIDGGVAVRFTQEIIRVLENFEEKEAKI